MDKRVMDILLAGFNGTITEADRRYYIDNCMGDEEKEIGKPYFEMDAAEALQFGVLSHNNTKGGLTGYDCQRCKNRGEFMIIKNGKAYFRDCECMKIRRSLANMERSGLGNLLELYTFDRYKCVHSWQTKAFNTAKAFVADNNAHLLFICGQSGAGKSHLCTAVAGKFLKRGMDVIFMPWTDASMRIKQAMRSEGEYEQLIDELKFAQVLYIDDFFKGDNAARPTSADIRLANEIINYRYNKSRIDKTKRYITIISTERTLEQLQQYDNALAGRIIELTRPNYLVGLFGEEKNYRLHGGGQ